jgi:hypothetical protein
MGHFYYFFGAEAEKEQINASDRAIPIAKPQIPAVEYYSAKPSPTGRKPESLPRLAW